MSGRVMVRRMNVMGDGHGDLAGHGGEHRAVIVYQTESYAHWETEVGRRDFTYGEFGENFTVQGLANDRECIRDRYRIGAAGVAAIVGLYKRVKTAGGTMRVVGIGDRPLAIFRLLRFDKIFDLSGGVPAN